MAVAAIYSQTSAKDKTSIIRRFQEHEPLGVGEDVVDILVGTIGVLAEGRTLTRASLVITVEPQYSESDALL